MKWPHERLGWRECLLHGILLLVLVAAVFPGTFLRGEMTLPGDLLYDIAPWRSYAPADLAPHKNFAAMEAFSLFHKYYALTKAALENGEWPLWNHRENAGMPLLANYQSMVFYPPRLLHVLFSTVVATTLFTLLKVWLCGFTAYVCGRNLGFGKGVARFFSVAWMLSGFNLIWCYWSPTDVAAWLPVLFMGTEFVLSGRYKRGFYAMSLGAVLLLLAGAPETAFAMGLGLGMYFVLRLALERRWGRDLWYPVMAAGMAWGLALAVCAVQVIPFVEYLAHSDTFFSRPGVEVNEYMYTPGALFSVWVPRFYGTDVDGNFWASKLNQTYMGMIYAGVSVWICAMLLFTRAGTPKKDRIRIACLVIPCVVGGLLAFRHPSLDFIHGLPVFGSMRPVYHMIFGMFALPLLASMGLQRWFEQPRKMKELLRCIPVPLIVAVGLGGVYFVFHRTILHAQGHGPYVSRQLMLSVLFGASAFAVLAVHCVWRRPRVLVGLLTVLLAFDLLLAVRGFNDTCRRDRLLIDTELTEFFEKEGPCRISAATAGITAGVLPEYGIEQWQGYDGMYPRRITEFRTRLGDDYWAAMESACAIDYYLYQPTSEARLPRDNPECLAKVGTYNGVDVYESPCALSRAFLVGAAEVIPDVEALYARMREPTFDPAAVALLERTPAGQLPGGSSGAAGEAAIESYASTRVCMDVKVERDCVLVLADSYYPGWTAEVDGVQAEVFPVDGLFRGVLLSEGDHVVHFLYFPKSFIMGLSISVAALILSGLGTGILVWRSSRRRVGNIG